MSEFEHLLGKEFLRHKQMLLRMVEIRGYTALLSVISTDTRVESFEVWLLRNLTPKSNGNSWGIRKPTDEEFGRQAWSYQYKENALKKMEEIEKRKSASLKTTKRSN